MTELIYCAGGSKWSEAIAARYGFTAGARLPGPANRPPEFVDQNWEKPDFAGYVEGIRRYRPRLATVIDFERLDQFSEVMGWVEVIAPYVTEAIIVIPKCRGAIGMLPRSVGGVPIRLGYSIPTTHGGTIVPASEFLGWDVHLLGGMAHKQAALAGVNPGAIVTAPDALQVVSADGNAHLKLANARTQFVAAGHGPTRAVNPNAPMLREVGITVERGGELAFTLSCINIREIWRGSPFYIRYASNHDIDRIDKIARSRRGELPFVSKVSLRESAARFEIFVACRNTTIIGFVRWHQRRDGWATVYDLAVAPGYTRIGAGRALLEAVPPPRRLKCKIDNTRANDFYATNGGVIVGVDPGKATPLYIWEWEADHD